MTDIQQHWDAVYATRAVDQNGWWEPTPEASLRLIDRCNPAPDDPILDAGGGASTFVDAMLDRGHTNITVADISAVALERARERLGARAASVRWLVGDLSDASALAGVEGVAVWHDRAVLHFLTEEADREAYASIVRRVVRPGGHVALAAFALTGARECSSLRVRNYDAEMLQQVLGAGFRQVDAFEHLYINPFGSPRPYVYALFQREG